MPRASSTPRGKYTMLWGSNGEPLTRCGKALGSGLKALCCVAAPLDIGIPEQPGLACVVTLGVTSHRFPSRGGGSLLYTPLFPAWALWESCHTLGLSTSLLVFCAHPSPAVSQPRAHQGLGFWWAFTCLPFLLGKILSTCHSHCRWRPAISSCPVCIVV